MCFINNVIGEERETIYIQSKYNDSSLVGPATWDGESLSQHDVFLLTACQCKQSAFVATSDTVT